MKSKHYLIAMLLAFSATSYATDTSFSAEYQTVAVDAPLSHTPYRMLASVGANGRTLEMDDGSVWAITDYSSSEVLFWRINDALVIHPCMCPEWSGSTYWIYNQNLRTYAYAELSLGPITNGACTNYIIYIDYALGEIKLRDARGYQNTWFVSDLDWEYIQTWRPDDAIIIGSYENAEVPMHSLSRYILINVQENQYVRAHIAY